MPQRYNVLTYQDALQGNKEKSNNLIEKWAKNTDHLPKRYSIFQPVGWQAYSMARL